MARHTHPPWPPIFLLAILLLFLPSATSVSHADVLLRFKQSLENNDALHNWKSGGTPCPAGEGQSWMGVICLNATLWGLQLEGMALTGLLDVYALAGLGDLRSLSVANNSFGGPFPNVSRLGSLKALYLSRNNFAGDIPAQAFAGMGSLKKVHLSDNQFSGSIPASLATAPKLLELNLANNRFTGELPDFQQSAQLKVLAVSNNQLEGPIPVGLRKFDVSSFTGNEYLCGQPLNKPCKAPSKKISGVMLALLIVFAIAIVLGTIGAIVAMFLNRRGVCGAKECSHTGKKKMDQLSNEGDSLERGSAEYKHAIKEKKAQHKEGHAAVGRGRLTFVVKGREPFELQDLLRASAEVMGAGSLGSCYKAMLTSGSAVVVKRYREMNGVGKEEFQDHMRRLGRLSHPNVLPLVAYYHRKEEKLLLTDFVENGTLMQALHGNRNSGGATLDWKTRLKIVKGVARGLSYIHDKLATLNLPHGHLKSSNILFGTNLDPILTDYGLVMVMNKEVAKQTLVAYRSPEYQHYGQVSKKTDVWNLGILILEVLTGKYPANYLAQGKAGAGTDLAGWVSAVVREEWTGEVFDKHLLGSRRTEGEMLGLLKIGLGCCEADVDKRWELREALEKIEELDKTVYHEEEEESSFASEDNVHSSREMSTEDEFSFSTTNY